MIDRRRALLGIGAAGTLLAFGGTTPATALTSKPQALMTEDQQLDLILKKLDSLPATLKNADPKTYPNYEQEIGRYLGNTTVVVPSTISADLGVARPQFNVGACIASLAGFVASTGIPVFKIIGWIRRARAIWGGFRGIWTAIRSGAAIREIGGEAATVLGELLGIGGVVNNCFN